MKRYILIVIFTCSFLSGFCADGPHYLTQKQIVVTSFGFVVNLNGQLYPADTITYTGRGIYRVTPTYYGSCPECGWALNSDIKCSNGKCESPK